MLETLYALLLGVHIYMFIIAFVMKLLQLHSLAWNGCMVRDKAGLLSGKLGDYCENHDETLMLRDCCVCYLFL